CDMAADLSARSDLAKERIGGVSDAAIVTSRLLTVPASMGCSDSLHAARLRELGTAIGRFPSAGQRQIAEQVLVAQALRFNFPADSGWRARIARSTGDFVLVAQDAVATGDRATLRARLVP